MLTLETAIKIIEKEILALKLPVYPVNLYNPIKYTLSRGGKRIRPALTLIACNLFSDNYKKAVLPALGIELFHNFTLIHDDLMDNSSLRRNDPTIHIKWNPNTAILAGDAMYIIACQLICKVENNILPVIISIFNQTALQVCEGQMMDMDFEKRNNVTVNQYLEMIGLKTSVLLASSLKIGAIIGGADPQSSEKVYNFGYNLGVAFQLQDDLLDSYGEENVFGKKIGNDILTNKKTYLYLKAIRLASNPEKKFLENLYSSETHNPEEKVKSVINIFNLLKIKALTQDIINEHYDKALYQLDEINISKKKKKVLTDFTETLKKREK